MEEDPALGIRVGRPVAALPERFTYGDRLRLGMSFVPSLALNVHLLYARKVCRDEACARGLQIQQILAVVLLVANCAANPCIDRRDIRVTDFVRLINFAILIVMDGFMARIHKAYAGEVCGVHIQIQACLALLGLLMLLLLGPSRNPLSRR